MCIGAGGLISHIAPALARKGIGALTILDDDEVEVSNLNRQRFYECDLGENKAIALAQNLQRECIAATQIIGYALRLETAIGCALDLACDVVVCGVDNHPARIAASRYFRLKRTPVIFTAVGRETDHGYVFVQKAEGPCFRCVFPDAIDSKSHPCPGTPAVIDILQAVGALAVYAVDSCLVNRPIHWSYRAVHLADGDYDACALVQARDCCPGCGSW